MAGQTGPVEFDIELSPESMRQLLAMAKAAEPTLKREVNKTLRAAGDVAAASARSAVQGATPPKAENRSRAGRMLGRSGASAKARGNGSMRAAVAKGVRVSIRAGKSPGIRIVSKDTYLPANKKALNRVYRVATFRHPVFGGPGWASQHGKDWFYKPLDDTRPRFESAVLAAMQAAAETLGRSD